MLAYNSNSNPCDYNNEIVLYQITPPRIIFSINSNLTVMILSKVILTTDYQTSEEKKKEIIFCTTVVLAQEVTLQKKIKAIYI